MRSFRGGNSRSSAATTARSFRTSMASTRSDPVRPSLARYSSRYFPGYSTACATT